MEKSDLEFWVKTKLALLVSVDVVRWFFIYQNILALNRLNFTFLIIEMVSFHPTIDFHSDNFNIEYEDDIMNFVDK